jgi:amino acid transporter
VSAFTSSSALMGDLGSRYLGAGMGDVITLGAAVSAFGCALACAVGASRLLFALARDGVLPESMAEISRRRGTPARATVAVVAAMAVIALVDGALFGAAPFDVFSWSGTIGTLILIVVYVLATVGAVRLLFFSGPPRVNRLEIVVPVLALLVLGYTLYRNVIPYPTGAAAWFPVVCTAWILLAVAFVLARPGVARRAGDRLTADSGLAEADHRR